MRRLESVVGRVATLVPNRKFAAARQVAVAAGLVEPAQATFLVRAHAAFVWTYYIRFFLLAGKRSRRRLLSRVTVQGEEFVQATCVAGEGAILLSVHLGDFDLAGAWLAARHSVAPVVVRRPLNQRWREVLFTCVRRRCGVVIRDAGDTRLSHLEQDLRDERAVLMMLDRRSPGPVTTSVLLGRPAVAPLAIAVLAARTGAPLLPAATWRDREGKTVVWFGQPVKTRSAGDGMKTLAACVATLERLILEHPEQWHVPADVSQMVWEAEPAVRADVPVEASRAALSTRLSA